MNIHEHILQNKADSSGNEDLGECLVEFKELKKISETIEIVDKDSVFKFVDCFNHYRNMCAYKFERRKNSGQELIRSTMLEGFFQMLFKDLVFQHSSSKDEVILGHANILSSFTISPFSYKDSFEDINFAAQMKDQDFVIGISSQMKIMRNQKEVTELFTIPFVVIECKTYIEKNMLETHMNSSKETKKIFPFCLYFIASEYMKMKTASPQRSALDEVYILTQEKNSLRERKFKQNLPIAPLNSDLVYDLFCRVKNHLENNWWDKESPFTTGTLIKNSD